MALFGPNGGVLGMLMASFLSSMKTPPVDFTGPLPLDSSTLQPEPSSPLSIVKSEPCHPQSFLQSEPSPLQSSLQPEPSPLQSSLQPESSPLQSSLQFSLQPEPSPLQSSLRSSLQPDPSPLQSSLQPKPQFHHYIPRFILRPFADNFSFSKAEFITDTSNPDLSGFKKEKPSKLRRNKWQLHDINVYRVEDHTTNPIDVARAYGAEDMYRDVTEADCMKFELLLSKLENTSAMFIRRILTDEQDLSLTRAQLADMKKFLIVMMYRSDHRRSQYSEQRFDPFTEMSIRKHMEHNDISNIQAVWFENLKWLIDTPFDDIVKEFEKARVKVPKYNFPAALLNPPKGPIHALELEEFGDMMTHFIVCIWEAPAGSEFILSEGCFGSWEGAPGFRFHRFFVVSPRFAIVLVNKKYVDHRAKGGRYWFSLFGDQLHETIYKNGPPPKDFDPAIHSTPKDVFKVQRIVIPKEEVYKVNGILLDARLQCLTYKSSASMCKSLRYYEKVKMKMFDNRHDYSTLRRKLFSDLNRTHAVDR